MKILVWNVATASILTTIDCQQEIISISWNFNGSRIVTSTKDKMLRVINPRTGEVLQVRAISFIELYSHKMVCFLFNF